ncbi:MAG: TonB-dependent receptor [Pseudomonadales bacterium]|nr:TonB-dependent receptor [Pseudomonadales bacterium]
MTKLEKSNKSNKSRHFLISALTAAIASVSGISYTQAQDEGSELQEISVTGSRIRATGMNTPTPVTAVDASELATMAPGNLIESLSQLPLFLNNAQPQTQFNFAGSAGASNLNLRGIGTQRTLVLLDGRRVVPSSRTNTVDIALFPDAMIRRVETVTGGASAAYGTDAMAGVVNFILDTEFTGIDGHLQGGTTQRGDGENWEGAFSFGTDIGEDTHLLMSVSGFQQNGIDGYQGRDWFQSYGTVTNPAWQSAINAGTCQINVQCAAGPQLITAPNVVSTQYTFGGLTVSPVPALNNLQFLSDGTVKPFQFSNMGTQGQGQLSQSIAPQFGGGSGDNIEADRGGEGGLIPEIERANAFVYLDRDLTDDVNVYFQSIFGSSKTNSPAFTSLMFGPWQATLFADNAFLPDNLRQTMVDNGVESVGFSSLRSTADLGQARFEQENSTMSYTTGFKADLNGGFLDGWHVDGYYQWGRTEVRIRQLDFARVDRIFLAMDAVVDPANGSVVCRAALANPDQFGGCVPLNLMGEGRASQEAIDYALGRNDGTNRKVQAANLEQHVLDFSANGELYEGWGAGAISAAIGASYRRDRIQQRITDPTNLPNDPTASVVPVNNPAAGIQGIPGAFQGGSSGFQFSGAQNFTGRINVYEAFTEVLVPVVSDMPFVQQFNLTGAGRWADYSGSGTVWSYKFGQDWQVYDDLRLRSTISRDVRAGSLSERFDQQGQGASGTDPFRGGQSNAFGQTIGGNPNIDPEKALTFTGGFVYQPSYIEGLSLSADFYRIRTKGLIAQLGTQTIIDQCFAGAENQCANITRGNPADDPEFGVGVITGVFNGFQNLGRAVVAGIDIEASYRTDINLFGSLGGGGESLSFRSFYSYLDRNSIDSDPTNAASNTKIDNAGNIAGSLPRHKITGNLTYSNGPFSAFIQERYISSGKNSIRINGVDAVEGIQIDDNKVRAAYYTDLNLSWTMDQPNGGEIRLYANVTNLLDENPPIRAGFFNFFGASQQVDALHDVLGRRFVAGMNFSF